MSNSDEHQRRSPDCIFFAYSDKPKSKAGRSKKGRDSKASRMSTLSNFTIVSEGVSVADTNAHGDDDTMPVVEPAKIVKSGKAAKKGAKAKKPASKSKKQNSKVVDENIQVASSFLEPEDDDFEVKVENTLTQSKGNKKRKSDAMSSAHDISAHVEAPDQGDESQDQPTKRRATRTRGSMAQTRNAQNPLPQKEYDHNAQRTDAEDIPPPAPPHGRKKGKGGKKRGSSNVRKVSSASTASKAPLRATIPPDEEIDAALEAELDRPLTDEEGDVEPPAMTEPKGRRLTRTKPGSKKATASVALTRKTTRASTVTADDSTMQDMYPSLPQSTQEFQVPTPEKDEHAALVHVPPEESSQLEPQGKETVSEILEQQNGYSKEVEEPATSEEMIVAADDHMDEEMPMIEPQQPRSRQASRDSSPRDTRMSDLARPFEALEMASDINSSVLGTQTAQDDSGHETDASVVKQARAKRGSRKAAAKKVKGGKKAALISRNIEEIVQPNVDGESPEEQSAQTDSVRDHTGSVEIISGEVKEPKKQRKPSKAIANTRKTKKTVPEPEFSAREESVAPLVEQPKTIAEAEIPRPQTKSPAHSTPRPASSRQSSDAENHPPSSCLSRPGPPSPLQSPLKSQSSRVPLAVTTPIKSPSRNTISKLQTTLPWTAVDLEHIFEATPIKDKENSPFVLGDAGEKTKSLLTSPEKKLTVEQWIQSNAQKGEEKLRNECERLVGKFEDQGVRALRVLEGIVCAPERL